MRVVFTKTRTASANTTIWAMIDLLSRIVVPKLADVAIIASRLNTTHPAGVRRLLRGATSHAEHILCGLAVQRVILDCVVAVSTSVPVPAIVALDFHVALVVLTAQDKLLFNLILLVLIVVVFYCPISWARVTRPQFVGILDVDFRSSRER